MNSSFKVFKELHQQAEPLLIGNVWNAQSARVFESKGFKAVATSSAAVAETLGYADGEEMTFDEYLFVVKRIKAAISLPLSVDLESGYGNSADDIARNLNELAAVGVAGVNIEDSIMKNGTRSILPANVFAKKIKQVMEILKEQRIEVFVNLRSDAFLLPLPDARKEAISRMETYADTGAHGIFLPCITALDDIKATVAASKFPLNVMCMPGLPDFQLLKEAGVKRISMGNLLNKNIYNHMAALTEQIVKAKNFEGLFKG